MPMGRSAQLSGRPDLTRYKKEGSMHDNPRASDEEQELAQTDRMDEEEEQRGGNARPDSAEQDESEE